MNPMEIKTIEDSVEQLLGKYTSSDAFVQRLLNTSIVILPNNEGYFSEHAERIFHYFSDNLPEEESVDACTEKECIPTQVLRSNEIVLGCFLLLSDTSFQIFLNTLSSYLYDHFRERNLDVKFSAILNEKTGKLKQIEYSGPVSGMEQIADILRNGK